MTTTTKKPPRRQYKDTDGRKMPGVTTVLGVLEKAALVPWAARIAAEATAAAIVDGGMPADAAIEKGRLAPFQRRQDAADAGTLAHACLEAAVAQQPPPEGATPEALACAERVMAWLIEKKFHVQASEWSSTIGDAGSGFGGTLDLILVDEDGKRYITDLKTGRAAYDEVVPQLAAYRHLWEMATKYESPINAGLVIHAPVDGTTITEIYLDETTLTAGWQVFQGALHVYHARKDARLPKPEEKDEVEL